MMEMKMLKEQTRIVRNRLNRVKRGNNEMDLFKVMSEIKRVRTSGERPRETIGDTDLFVFECDLCLMKIKEGDLTQCAYCGRWICRKQCYSTDEAACISCESIIRLKRESVEHIKDILKNSEEISKDGSKGEEQDHG